jgi:hypothetical protein
MREPTEEEKKAEAELTTTRRQLEEVQRLHNEAMRAVAVLMAAGIVSQEKWEQAIEIVSWK